MSGGGCRREPVKVVIISTQYVETDATSFKSVVQKLTGKDSDHIAAAAAASGKADSERKAQREKSVGHNRGGVEVPAATCGQYGSSFLMRDLSFKEFDRLLREMPPISDLWSD